MARIRALWSEFKAFAFKGNMIDLAVAVVIGAAFSGVITSLVGDIVMPGISYVVTAFKQTAESAQKVAEKATSAVGITTLPSSQPSTQPTTEAGTTQPTTEASTQPALAQVPPAEAALIKELVQEMKAATPPPPPPEKEKLETKAVDFSWKVGRFGIGSFVGSLINFLLVAFAVFMFIVKLLGSVMKKVGGTPAPSEPTTRECPLCLSVIPIKAKRCAHCTADLTVPT